MESDRLHKKRDKRELEDKKKKDDNDERSRHKKKKKKNRHDEPDIYAAPPLSMEIDPPEEKLDIGNDLLDYSVEMPDLEAGTSVPDIIAEAVKNGTIVEDSDEEVVDMDGVAVTLEDESDVDPITIVADDGSVVEDEDDPITIVAESSSDSEPIPSDGDPASDPEPVGSDDEPAEPIPEKKKKSDSESDFNPESEAESQDDRAKSDPDTEPESPKTPSRAERLKNRTHSEEPVDSIPDDSEPWEEFPKEKIRAMCVGCGETKTLNTWFRPLDGTGYYCRYHAHAPPYGAMPTNQKTRDLWAAYVKKYHK